MDGFINLLKPPGMTSSDAVVYVRRRLPRGTKVGHAGTLDPEAAGVLPVMVGRAARLSDYIMSGAKEYVCEIALGAATDTQDAQGTLRGEVHEPATADALRAVLGQFTGDIMQAPSAYSALKQDGRKLCDIARAGGEVHTQPRPVSIYELEYLRQTARDASAEMTVYFNDEAAIIAAGFAKQIHAVHIVTGMAGTPSNGFIEMVHKLLPQIPISMVAKDETVYHICPEEGEAADTVTAPV